MGKVKKLKSRIAEIEKLENGFLETLRYEGFDVSPDAVCTIRSGAIELGVLATGFYASKGFKIAFGSEVSLYPAEFNILGATENTMNFATSGSFSPSNKESYWRTVHAASILKNWERACDIINTFCKMYHDLGKM